MREYRGNPFNMTIQNLDMLIERINNQALDMRLDIPQRIQLTRDALDLTELKYHLIQRAIGQS